MIKPLNSKIKEMMPLKKVKPPLLFHATKRVLVGLQKMLVLNKEI
jgi:hypothetical protein